MFSYKVVWYDLRHSRKFEQDCLVLEKALNSMFLKSKTVTFITLIKKITIVKRKKYNV
jgi:hypothetical protein